MYTVSGENYKYKIPYEVNISSMNNNYSIFAYGLEYVKETSKSIYAKSLYYGWTYRIEKDSKKVFCDGKQIANTCEYDISHYYTNEKETAQWNLKH